MKYIVLIFALLFSQGATAKKHDHSVGIHGMVLMLVDDRLFASHLPLHGSKHAVQLVLELKVEGAQLHNIKTMLKENPLVTLMPQTFSLSELRSGNITGFKGEVFAGHFERGATISISNVQFKVGEQLLNQPLKTNKNGGFYVIGLKNKLSLLVHRIGSVPSFDQILLVQHQEDISLPALLPLGNQAPLKQLPKGKFKLIKQLYLETRDFT